MVIDCEVSWRKKTRWHRWFAWRPVRISDDQLVWLETIERRFNWKPYAFIFLSPYEVEYRRLED